MLAAEGLPASNSSVQTANQKATTHNAAKSHIKSNINKNQKNMKPQRSHFKKDNFLKERFFQGAHCMLTAQGLPVGSSSALTSKVEIANNKLFPIHLFNSTLKNHNSTNPQRLHFEKDNFLKERIFRAAHCMLAVEGLPVCSSSALTSMGGRKRRLLKSYLSQNVTSTNKAPWLPINQGVIS